MLALETAHSPNAQDITTITVALLVLAAIIVIAVNAGLLAVLLRFRASRGREPARFRGRPQIHARATAGFAALAALLFVLGVIYTEKANETPDAGDTAAHPPLDVKVIGQQWIWRYEYTEQESRAGGQSATSPVASSSQSFADVFSYFDLVVPVDTLVNLDFESTDVVHRWWVPALGGKLETIPGHSTQFSFRADEEGTYDGASTAFSGTGFPNMRTRVRVVPLEEYNAWVTQQAADIKTAQTTVQALQVSGTTPGVTPEEAATAGTGQ